MEYTDFDLNCRIKGVIAEKIFELLHIELGCQVFRTGQEFLYPSLFSLANEKRIKHHNANYDADLNALKEFGGTNNEKQLIRSRFRKSEAGIALASSPDFTIISHAGKIEQFEVKFRGNGSLSEEDKQRYLKREVPPNIFLVMGVPPFIDILLPRIRGLGEGNIAELGNQIDFWKKVQENPKKFIEYLPIERGDGEMILIDDLESDKIVYNKELLEKYVKLIKNWYSVGK